MAAIDDNNAAESADGPVGMLNGVRVIEIGQVLSAPFAAMILADLGAEVIKIEKPEGGDDARRMGPAFRGADSMTFMDTNRNKRSVVLDLKTDEGRQMLHQLLADADVLIHNLRPGVAEQLGIHYEGLRYRHPRLVYHLALHRWTA